MDIEELQGKVIEFRDKRDWAPYHNPKDLAISISLEAAELLEIFQWKKAEVVWKNPAERERVKEELGDVLIYSLNMCDAFGFDPSDVVLSKLKINEKKYPVEKAKGSSKKYTKYQTG